LPKISPIESDECKRNYQFEECKASSLYQDSMRVYRKYLAKDTLGLNHIPEELKANIESVVISEDIELLVQYLTDAQKIIYTILDNE
jgi:hypothetical protein